MIGGFIGTVVIYFIALSVVRCDLPEYIKVCPRDHVNLSACIMDSIEHIRPRLEKGIPEIEVPPMEPLEMDPVRIDSEGSSSRIAYNLSNIRVWGPSQFKVSNLIPKKTNTGWTFRYHGLVPQLHIEGSYDIDSKILFLVLQGNGPFNASVANYEFDCLMKGEVLERNGSNHLIFEDIELKISFGGTSIFLDNLFNGNQVLGTATNAVLNDNSKLLFEEIKPGIQRALEKRFTEISNKITQAFTYEQLFP